MKPVLLLLATCLTLGGCGASHGLADAASDAGAEAGPEAGRGVLAFEIASSVKPSRGLPPLTHTFTLVLDRANGRAIAGGGGQARVVPLTTTDGRRFRTSTPFEVGLSESECAQALGLVYQTMELTLDGDLLSGEATGHVKFNASDTPADAIFLATFEGTPDTAPPFLISPPGQTVTDPLSDFVIWPSEPLPETATARLISSTDAVFTLAPNFAEGNPRLVASFSKPTITLPPGESFRVVLDAEADFADNRTLADDSLRLARFDEVPLVLPDGFETGTEVMLDGATLVHGPDIAIAGGASIFIGGRLGPAEQTPQFLVQMAVPTGATKLRFSYRALSAQPGSSQAWTIRLGSLAREPSPAVPFPSPLVTTKLMWASVLWDATDATTMDVPLPDAIGSDVVILIRLNDDLCGRSSLGALVLDDLRIE